MNSASLLHTLRVLCRIWIPLLITGWFEFAHAQQHMPDRSAPATTYTAVVLRDFPPLYQVGKDMQPDGYAIDILRQVAARAGFSVTFFGMVHFIGKTG